VRYSIVGQKHLELDAYLESTLHGTPAVLVRDPENKVDPRAVMVWIGGAHVGYIPMKTNKTLAAMIDETGFDYAVGDSVRKATDATFVRSPNSGYPMVEVPPIAVQEELKVDQPQPADAATTSTVTGTHQMIMIGGHGFLLNEGETTQDAMKRIASDPVLRSSQEGEK
jgi:hypothetical protein